jgi:sulfonate transport system substrate-binding protein
MSNADSFRRDRRQALRLTGAAAIAITGFPALAQSSAPNKITLGYQTLWAGGGEIWETLRNTNILELHGIEAEFKTFTSGPPLGEAAVAGAVDNFFAADAPVLRAAARLPGSKVLARSHDARYAVLAQPDFKGGLADLRGKTLSGLFGTTVFPRAVRQITAAGVAEPFKEIRIINQDVADAAASLQAKQVDAIVTWDPTQEKLQRLGYKSIYDSKQGENFGWIGLTGNWLQKNGDDAAVRFLKAWITAAWWTSNNLEQSRTWFAATSRIDKDILLVAENADRYLRKPVADIATIDFRIDAATAQGSQAVIDFLVSQKLLAQRIDVNAFVDVSAIERAQVDIKAGRRIDPARIAVRRPAQS